MRAARDVRDVTRRPFPGRRAVVLAALGVAAAGGSVAAGAQAPSPPGDYGGGTIAKLGTGPYSAGSIVISLHATQDGGVQIFAGMGSSCALITFKAHATLAPDGSFAVSGTARERFGDTRLRTKYTITGTVTASGAAGAASARSTVKRPGEAAFTCSTGTVQWAARRPTGAVGTPGAPPPAARLYGYTSQRVGNKRHPITLRLSAAGDQLVRALYTENLPCGRPGPLGFDSPGRNLPIGADGKIANVERFNRRDDARTRLVTVERFNATIGSLGATGTLSIKARYVDIRSGHTISRCSTGLVRWSASL